MPDRNRYGDMRILVFPLGPYKVGVDIRQVLGMVDPHKQTLHAAGRFNGADMVLELDGETIPVFDMLMKMDLAPLPAEFPRILLTSRGNRRIGIYVDDPEEIVLVRDQDIHDLPCLVKGGCKVPGFMAIAVTLRNLVSVLDLHACVAHWCGSAGTPFGEGNESASM